MKTIRILSGGAAQGLVEALQPSFEAGTGCRIDGVFGAVGAMQSRLLAGEPADIMILSRALIDGLARDGHVVTQSTKDIGSVQTAIAVRSGDPLPAVGDAAELRAALLAADAIHFPDPEQSTAGIHFAKVLRDLGIRDAIAQQLRPAANGATAMRALAASKSRQPLGCTQRPRSSPRPAFCSRRPCRRAATWRRSIAAPSPRRLEPRSKRLSSWRC
jgi:molybdate transport system substrate-binding protein